MKLLVIKQTSLGDVLHSTGHVRAIKQTWPDSELVLLTSTSCAQIFRHNPWVDHIIEVDRYGVKKKWLGEPVWAWTHMADVMRQIRQYQFDMAFDLQGLAKSVVFLYGAHARQKFVKGHWPGLSGFRKPHLHAIAEMSGVLELAGVKDVDTSMEFATSSAEEQVIDSLLETINPENQPLVILSPYSRWQSKDWPLENFLLVAEGLVSHCKVVITGAAERAEEINNGLHGISNPAITNLAGKLNLIEFAALVKRGNLMLTGDSFPMHVAAACSIPLIALFGPTDETRVGPKSNASVVVRAPDCNACDRKECKRGCLGRITPESIQPLVLDKLRIVTGD